MASSQQSSSSIEIDDDIIEVVDSGEQPSGKERPGGKEHQPGKEQSPGIKRKKSPVWAYFTIFDLERKD